MPFQLDVVSPDGVVWSGEAELVIARTIEGEIGIMADHEPTMAALATGAVEVTHSAGKTEIGVQGGFMQVVDNKVTLLTDRAQISEGDKKSAAELASELAGLDVAEEVAEFVDDA